MKVKSSFITYKRKVDFQVEIIKNKVDLHKKTSLHGTNDSKRPSEPKV
jgi:hypothetical protein